MNSAYSVRALATESPTLRAACQVRVGAAAVVLAEAQQLDVDRVFCARRYMPFSGECQFRMVHRCCWEPLTYLHTQGVFQFSERKSVS